MKIVFMGTPEFAIPSLKKILNSSHTVSLVITAPDKERGRGKKISNTPVKEFALENNLEVLTPISLKEDSFLNRLREVNADLFVVVAFRILPREVYKIPQKGTFNLHGSLLPKYRGAAPIQWALINGDKETGLTTFFIEDKVDTGNIILSEKISIGNDENLGSLHDRMMMLGADLVLKTIEVIESGDFKLTKQNEMDASPAPKIKKETCRINWNNTSEQIHNLVRGLSPYPAAFFELNGKNYKVYKTSKNFTVINSGKEIIPPGTIQTTKNEIHVKTSDGFLQILELQPEGRKRMTAEEFLRGYSFQN